LADDTTVLLNNKTSVPKVLQILKLFHKISGLKANVDKTSAHALGTEQVPKVGEPSYGLLWKKEDIRLLGVLVTSDPKKSLEQNFKEKINSIEGLTHIWAQRNLTIKGKITVINSLLIPKLIYPCTVLCTPEEVLVEVTEILDKFLWNWKRAKIKKAVMVQNIANGGLRYPDFRTKVESWRTIWWRKTVIATAENKPLWLHIVDSQLPENIPFSMMLQTRLSKVNLDMAKNHLPQFYCSVLDLWQTLTKDILPRNAKELKSEYLWWNKYITMDRVSLYWHKWYKAGIKKIEDILSDDGNFMSLEELNEKYDIKTNFLNVLQIRQSIPGSWRNLLKNNTDNQSISQSVRNMCQINGRWKKN